MPVPEKWDLLLWQHAHLNGIQVADLLGRDHPYYLSRVRQEAWLAMYEAGATQMQIGALFGRTQHTISRGLSCAFARRAV